jgi:hypothetical protein
MVFGPSRELVNDLAIALAALWAACSIFRAENNSGEKNKKTEWRRGWDSNPRLGFPNTRFPSVLLKPLGHLSTVALD